MFSKFIQISLVPFLKRQAAQRRARAEGITAVPLTPYQFRVKSSGGWLNVLSRDAVLNRDYYEVRTFESDGELFATCSCPFGQKGEDEPNVCKHVEAALSVRTRESAYRSGYVAPVFQSGKIIIDITRNDMTIVSSATNSNGTPFVSAGNRRRRLAAGTGESAYSKLLTFIDNTF